MVTNIKFIEMQGEGFQSIGNASINFTNLGTCFINGINKYDSKTKSNGSGKSSLLMMLYWCIFGKTPTGIGNNVVNKFYKKGCTVKLDIIVDDVKYSIRRSQNHYQYKTNLSILKNSEDISGRNKTDSDKLIKDILKINEDVFLQMIFLSQGFANRFSIYSPKARKELLESLYNIDEKLIIFVNELKQKESICQEDILNISNSIIEITTKSNMLLKNNNDINQSIQNVKNKINNLELINFDISKNEIEDLQNKIKMLSSQHEIIYNKYVDQKSEVNNIEHKINDYNFKKNEKEKEINKFSNNKKCPYCGTILEDYEHNEHVQSHIKELYDEIEQINKLINDNNNNLKSSNEILNRINEKMKRINNDLSNVQNELFDKSNKYEQLLQKNIQIEEYKNKISEYLLTIDNNKNDIESNNKALDKLNVKITNKNKELEILQHSIRLANNQFKAYLLENIINHLNNKLEELSKSLFENEIIKINGDSKLDIMLGDKIYEQLSGGERNKVDIAMIIAQRFLAQQMNTISSNILICDEIFDGLDDISFSIVLDLLSTEMQDVESTFIISHRDIKEIPFDNIITVIKDKNQISYIE